MSNTTTEMEKIYFALSPDFMQRREGKCLLLWSYLPFWIVVDNKNLKLLTLFNGKNTLKDIISSTAKEFNLSPYHHERDVKNFVTNLIERKILSDKPEKLKFNQIDNVGAQIIDELTILISDKYNDDNILTLEELKETIKDAQKFLTKNALLRILSDNPIKNSAKILGLIKYANIRDLNIILDAPLASYTDDLLLELSKHRVQIQINFDGALAEINDSIQGQGSFDKNLELAKKLTQKRIATIFNLNASEHNYQEMENLLKIALNLNIKECRIVPLKKLANYKEFRSPDYREIVSYLAELINKNPQYEKILGRDIFHTFENIINTCEHRSDCGAAKKQIMIGADGKVYPCVGYKLSFFAAGNIKTQSFEDIWLGSEVLIKLRLNNDIAKFPQCKKCVIRHWCRGGCRAESFINTRRDDQPAISCKSIQLAFLDLFWMLESIKDKPKPSQPYC